MRASSQCGVAPEQHQEPTGTGAQRARIAAILYVEEEDQFDELELALEKASGSYQEELKRSSAPVLPRLMPVNFAGAIMNVRELLIPSVSFHRHELRQEPPPPLDLSFWSFRTVLHHSIEEVGRLLLLKFYKKIRRKSWSNMPPK